MCKIHTIVSVILFLLPASFALWGEGRWESVQKEGVYTLPFYSEEWLLENSTAPSAQTESPISINSEAVMSSYAFLAVELSKTRPELQLVGINQARSLIHDGYDITLICRYRKFGTIKYLKALIHNSLTNEQSLEKLILDIDFKS